MFDVKQRQKARQHSFIFQQTPNLRLPGLFDHLRVHRKLGRLAMNSYRNTSLTSRGQVMLKMSGLNVLTRSQGLVRRNYSLALFDLPAQTITLEIQKDLRLLK
ncbi:hypothetical protein SO802_010923, partial [Lithocarpus litseifolius]